MNSTDRDPGDEDDDGRDYSYLPMDPPTLTLDEVVRSVPRGCWWLLRSGTIARPNEEYFASVFGPLHVSTGEQWFHSYGRTPQSALAQAIDAALAYEKENGGWSIKP